MSLHNSRHVIDFRWLSLWSNSTKFYFVHINKTWYNTFGKASNVLSPNVLFDFVSVYLFVLFILYLQLTCIYLYSKSHLRSTIYQSFIYVPALGTAQVVNVHKTFHKRHSGQCLKVLLHVQFMPCVQGTSKRTKCTYIHINIEMWIKNVTLNRF